MGDASEWKPTEYAAKLIKFKAKQLVGTYAFTENDREDIEQELLFRLWQGSSSYTRDRGHINALTKVVIRNAVARLVERQQAKKRACPKRCLSLNEELDGGDGEPVQRGDLLDQDAALRRLGRTPRHFTDEADLRMMVEEVIAGLSPESQALADQLKRLNPTELSRLANTARGTLLNRIAKLGKPFSDAGVKEFLRIVRRSSAGSGTG